MADPGDWRKQTKKLDSPTSLTEFPRLSSDKEEKSGSYFFSRLFRPWSADSSSSPDKDPTPPESIVTTTTIQDNSVSPVCETKKDDIEGGANITVDNEQSISPTSLPRSDIPGYGRSGILQRISHMIDRSGSTLYKDNTTKQYWMPDSSCKECYECNEKFTTLRRKHHCRVCGRIFCSKCCNQDLLKKIVGCGDIRVCTYCSKVVQNFIQAKEQENQMAVAAAARAQTQSNTSSPHQYNLARRKTSVGFREEALVKRECDSSDMQYADSSFPSPPSGKNNDKIFASELWVQINDREQGLSFIAHRSRLATYDACITGGELVDWLISHEKARSRTEAIEMGQMLLDLNYLKPLATSFNPNVFVDGGSLYASGIASSDDKNLDMSLYRQSQEDTEADPEWLSKVRMGQDEEMTSDSDGHMRDSKDLRYSDLQQSNDGNDAGPCNSTFQLNLNLKEHRVHITRPLASERTTGDDTIPEELMDRQDGQQQNVDLVVSSERCAADDCVSGAMLAGGTTTSIAAFSTKHASQEAEMQEAEAVLESAYAAVEKEMLSQLLASEGLPVSWSEVILSLVSDVVSTVVPNVLNDDDMDIRQYVHVKKIPGDTKSASCVVWGAVLSKNLVHKSMRDVITNPRVLLVSSPIVYQRYENKISCLDPILLQEHEYLRNVMAKIKTYQPDVLLVEKTVSRFAREQLLEMGVTLVINVKSSSLERIARLTNCSIVDSLDAQLVKPKLGRCGRFCVRTYTLPDGSLKSLLVFEGCPKELGCTVFLRGGTTVELSKVKRVFKFMTFMRFNWKMEKAFLLNERALPPVAKPLEVEEGFTVAEEERSTAQTPTDWSLNRMVSMENEDSVRHLQSKTVEDFSDPLSRCQDDVDYTEDTDSHQDLKLVAFPLKSKFKQVLDNILLNCSPFMKIELPYLETEAGRRSNLRKYFTSEIYYSPKLSDDGTLSRKPNELDTQSIRSDTHVAHEDIRYLDSHPFVDFIYTDDPNNNAIKEALLADYRARGGRIQVLCPHQLGKPTTPRLAIEPVEQIKESTPIDALSPYNHQRLSVLFCSYSPRSANAPQFCVSPWIVQMDFYGRNDIALGEFLERYCFRQAYNCPSSTCETQMNEHIRKFVHGNGCIQIQLHQLEKPVQNTTDSIFMWSWCRTCRYVSSLERLSKTAWSLSFAKYLELRFHGQAYGCRSPNDQCTHLLHRDHYQYFAMRQTVASFKYTPISLGELVLPSAVIMIHDCIVQVPEVVQEIRKLAEDGENVHSAIMEILGIIRGQVVDSKHEAWINEMIEIEKEQKMQFKQRIEELQILLTSPHLRKGTDVKDIDNDNEASRLSWEIFDHIVRLKLFIANAVTTWNRRIHDFEAARRKEEKTLNKSSRQTSMMDSGSIQTEVVQEDASLDAAKLSDPRETPANNTTRQTPTVVIYPEIDFVHDTINDHTPGTIDDVPELEGHTPVKESLVSSCEESPSRSYDRGYSDNGDNRLIVHQRSVPLGSKSLDDPDATSSVKRGTVRAIFSQLLNNNAGCNIPSPYLVTEHFMPCEGSVPVIVHEEEPSSIVAYALSTAEYAKQLVEVQSQLLTAIHNGSSRRPEDSLDFTDLAFGASQEHEKKGAVKVPNMHVEIQFNDANTQFYCRAYFAEQFRKLRCLVFPHGEERFIHSLARCVTWSARGGKSGVMFCKTRDDRFIIKQMLRYEVQSFLEFAPLYFQHISKATMNREPTVLAKIVGVYRIGFKNNASGSESKMDILIMENLFYGRNIDRKFDLKGSVRNRLVNGVVSDADAAHSTMVLLDENLLRIMCEEPLYIRPHSKRVLTMAISNDAEFLKNNSVMDYSLLVGIDSSKKELVVGIIDYIRTFTWDKRIEMMVKSVNRHKLPTIVSPDLYRTRFCEAMDKYFVCVPDQWSGLSVDNL